DPLAVARETVAELDVLDRGIAVPLIEAARGEEHVAPDRAASGPERRRGRARRLVNVMMEEVTVLRQEVRGIWLVVVGPEHGGQARIVLERGEDLIDRVWPDGHVGVHEEEEIAGGGVGAEIAGSRRPFGHRTPDHPRAEPGGDPGRLVR